ncbi:hypothetical protein WR25_23333 isoform A [Diploscapter pachys]|uniref:Cytochrome P450 n=1 Tax=Diploscapter pachys TaxID=2018661 RepID=A0A2A2LK84_9BILA|nr:hypothetical protein WR25_23333 isoform A [Diploscapter pachys]
MLVVALIVTIIFYLVFRQWRLRQEYPPGPTPVPFLGNIPHLMYYSKKYGSIVEAMRHFKNEYGGIYTLWFGTKPVVQLVEYDISQEAMVKKGSHFINRWIPKNMDVIRKGHGLITSNGDYWQEQRRFALHTLRNFGLGRNFMEERIMEEFELKFKELDKLNGEPVFVHDHFDILVGSIINRMLFSYRFDEKNAAEFYALKREMDKTLEKASMLFATIPSFITEMIPYLRNKRLAMQKPFWGVKNFISKQVDERLKEIEEGRHQLDEEGEDFCDAYYIEMKKQQEANPNTGFYKESLICAIFDLWVAGQETTSLTLNWASIYLLNNPHVEEKVRKELQEVTGDSRNLSLLDKPKTPYLLAVINEVQRLASILNTNIFRQATDDVQIGDYLIKKGTPVVSQLSVIMSEENVFEKKFDFNPDRYFAKDRLDQHVIPFGAGKRECLGKSLALAELYLILGNMILRYKLEPAGSLPTTEQVSGSGTMHRPKKYKMCFVKLQN